MENENVLAFVLGGGAGNRLTPLTKHRAKPAVPFGGTFRIIDFVLSNLYNSNVRKAYVLTQYQSSSLHDHIRLGWYPRFGFGPNGYLRTQPASKSPQGDWYSGTADAITQNIRFIDEETPGIVDVFGGDHIYLMDLRQMHKFHLENDADITISAIPVKRELAKGNYGVLEVDEKGKLLGFEEKPFDPKPMPKNPDMCLSSMGNYSFKPSSLLEALVLDKEKKFPKNKNEVIKERSRFSTHDFGYDIIPGMLLEGKRVFVYNFMDNDIEGMEKSKKGYWRDIGDRDQFYDANMELKNIIPPINIYNKFWPVLTYIPTPQGAKINGEGVKDSILSNGCIITNSSVNNSVLSYSTIIEKSTVSDSIFLGYAEVGEKSQIYNAVIDRHVKIPPGTKIGLNKEEDIKRGFYVTESGRTFVPEKHNLF